MTKHTTRRQSRKNRGEIFINETFRKNWFRRSGETEEAKNVAVARLEGDVTDKDEAGL
jgi:hypothetical protein